MRCIFRVRTNIMEIVDTHTHGMPLPDTMYQMLCTKYSKRQGKAMAHLLFTCAQTRSAHYLHVLHNCNPHMSGLNTHVSFPCSLIHTCPILFHIIPCPHIFPYPFLSLPVSSVERVGQKNTGRGPWMARLQYGPVLSGRINVIFGANNVAYS